VYVALASQYAKRMRCIMSSMACLALPYFSTSTQTARFSEKRY